MHDLSTGDHRPENGFALRALSPAEVLARRCVAPLRLFTEAGGHLAGTETPSAATLEREAIDTLEALIVAYLESLRRR